MTLREMNDMLLIYRHLNCTPQYRLQMIRIPCSREQKYEQDKNLINSVRTGEAHA